jgi:hypothetical protein
MENLRSIHQMAYFLYGITLGGILIIFIHVFAHQCT